MAPTETGLRSIPTELEHDTPEPGTPAKWEELQPRPHRNGGVSDDCSTNPMPSTSWLGVEHDAERSIPAELESDSGDCNMPTELDSEQGEQCSPPPAS